MVDRGGFVRRAWGGSKLFRAAAAISALTATGCCRPPAKFPADVAGGATVFRDEYVEEWWVNGGDVCEKVIQAAPGCYVLEVQYGAKYVKETKDSGPPYFSALIHPFGPMMEQEASKHRAEYHSRVIPFAVPLEHLRWYWVTATFNGDEFLPRIVITDAAGERLGEVAPARSAQELRACRAGSLRSAPTPGEAPQDGSAARERTFSCR